MILCSSASAVTIAYLCLQIPKSKRIRVDEVYFAFIDVQVTGNCRKHHRRTAQYWASVSIKGTPAHHDHVFSISHHLVKGWYGETFRPATSQGHGSGSGVASQFVSV